MSVIQALPILGDMIGAVGNAAYTPEANPAYGAVQVSPDDYVKHLKASGIELPDNYTPPSNHMWLTPDGKDVTYAVNNLGMSPNEPFQRPGFMSKLTSSVARDTQSRNMAASAFPGQSSQATTALLSTSGRKRDYMAGNLSNALGVPNSDQLQGTVGAAGEGGFTGGIDPNAPIHSGVAGREINKGIVPLLAQTGVNAATTQDILGQGQLEASPFAAENLVSEARDVTPREQMAREAMAQFPGLGTSSYMMGDIDPYTGLIKSVKNPAQSMAGVLVGNAMQGGQGEYHTEIGPSGKQIRVKNQESPLRVTPLSYDLGRHVQSGDTAEQPPSESSTTVPRSQEHIKALLSDPQLPHGLKYILAHTLVDSPDWYNSVKNYLSHDELMSHAGHAITGE